ncbi:hypothetical protein ScSA15_10220 [Streptococcus canis]
MAVNKSFVAMKLAITRKKKSSKQKSIETNFLCSNVLKGAINATVEIIETGTTTRVN